MPPATALLRFDGTLERDPAIDAWLAARPQLLGDIATAWFERIRACGPGVREVMHDGCPAACVGDAALAYVNVFASHVNVGFFRGAMLSDPAGLLEGTGKSGRHVKLRPGAAVDAPVLDALIQAAYAELVAHIAADTSRQ